ncbi:MAG TPA: hypothetical protein VKZ49_05260 [Polyangiaceae bacterium]|nr:hypothetical protein [Polyangiaceae bacterium]
MKIRAVAVADPRSNAVGAIELECTPHGLVVGYLGLGAFSEGYAPGALTMGTQLTVPWSAVQLAELVGDRLHLEFSPEVGPHSRLCLTNFSTGNTPHPGETRRQRRLVRIATAGTALAGVLLATLTFQRAAPEAGAGAAMLVALVTAAAVLTCGLIADRAIGAPDYGDAPRESFVFDLSNYLPGLIRTPKPSVPSARPLPLPTFQQVLPRTTLAVVIALTSSTLAALLVGGFIIDAQREPSRTPVASLAAAPPAAPVERRPEDLPAIAAPRPAEAAPSPATSTASVTSGKCTCRRGDSGLWQNPIPRLSTLVLSRRVSVRGRHSELQADIAAINNSDEEIRDLELHLEFFERDPPPISRLHHVDHRVLYYPGVLSPGQAIKWSVEADGSELQIKNPIAGDIGPGGDGAAPLSRFAELLDANHRPVRMHGALMLAYLGDPRAREAVLKLREALREDEAPYLRRLTFATAPVHACNLRVSASGPERQIEACVFNDSKESKKDLALRVAAYDGEISHLDPLAQPPLLVAEGTYPVSRELMPGEGVRVLGKLDLRKLDEPPAAFEAIADRIDLLP